MAVRQENPFMKGKHVGPFGVVSETVRIAKGLRGNNSVLADVSERCATALPAARGAQVVLARALTVSLRVSCGIPTSLRRAYSRPPSSR